MEIDEDEPEMLGSVLTRLPRPLDLEELIRTATRLFENHPPQSLGNRAWRHISKNSVLNTTHEWRELETQTLEDGEHWFTLQAKEAERADAWKKRRQELVRFAKRHKQTAKYSGLAVLVAFMAIAFRDPRFQAVTYGISPILRSSFAMSKTLVEVVRGVAL
nr:hypothetical protein CFP56_16726 [Quercus suber]